MVAPDEVSAPIGGCHPVCEWYVVRINLLTRLEGEFRRENTNLRLYFVGDFTTRRIFALNLSKLDILWKNAKMTGWEDHTLEFLCLSRLYFDDVFDVCHKL